MRKIKKKGILTVSDPLDCQRKTYHTLWWKSTLDVHIESVTEKRRMKTHTRILHWTRGIHYTPKNYEKSEFEV